VNRSVEGRCNQGHLESLPRVGWEIFVNMTMSGLNVRKGRMSLAADGARPRCARDTRTYDPRNCEFSSFPPFLFWVVNTQLNQWVVGPPLFFVPTMAGARLQRVQEMRSCPGPLWWVQVERDSWWSGKCECFHHDSSVHLWECGVLGSQRVQTQPFQLSFFYLKTIIVMVVGTQTQFRPRKTQA